MFFWLQRWTNGGGYRIIVKQYAGMAELADAPDLGSGVPDVQVQVLLPAPTFRQQVFLKLHRRLSLQSSLDRT